MKVVASVQAKRGSSRGLVHYLAHSKLDVEREPQNTRELFNAFTDTLSVKDANNSIKVGVARGRPSNDELHHLVLSFRTDDYRKLAGDESQRRRSLKEITRGAMEALKTALEADRLSWVAAVHLNTENPHVHIALQKQYFRKDLERQTMTKIPRETLPHYEVSGGEKVLVAGLMIEAATKKMEQLIARDLGQRTYQDNDRIRPNSKPDSSERKQLETDAESGRDANDERDILRRGILAEYELRRIESRIISLTDHGDKMRFLVSDPVSGVRRRLSLQDVEGRESGSDPKTSPTLQIHMILLKMLAKEEAAKAQLEIDLGNTIQEADRIRTHHKKEGRKLPIPSLSKEELDKLQENWLNASDIRRFSFLERIRSERETLGEIEPRDKTNLGRISAKKAISNLRARLHEKNYSEFSDRRYYRLVDVDNRRVSIAQLDREVNASGNSILSLVEKLNNPASRLSGKAPGVMIGNESDGIRDYIVKNLDDHLESIKREQRTEQNKVKVLEKILSENPDQEFAKPAYSPEQLAEIETLSLRLKLGLVYEQNCEAQRVLIQSAGSDCPAYKKLQKVNPAIDFAEHKNNIIAGRTLAREIVARVELGKAKEDLKIFKESKRFQKFVIADKITGKVDFVSLHEVDLPNRGSLLDRAIDELFESRKHRSLRNSVVSLVKDREQRLKDEVTAAKDMMSSAARNASAFKQFSLFGLISEATQQPIFTSSEVTLLEIRAANTRNPKEAARLKQTLEIANADQPARSLREILRDFESPEMTSVQGRGRDSSPQEKLSRNGALDDVVRAPRTEERSVSKLEVPAR